MTYLEVRAVSRSFNHRQGRRIEPMPVLDQVSFQVEAGKFCCLIGTSGCGKSTLLRIIDGLLTADVGQVAINDQIVTRPGLDRAMVFQGFNLLPWRTVLGNVEYGLEMLSLPKRERHDRAMEYIRLMGLTGFERYRPAELSGGMQQRVGLARALAIQPKLLLMDEPFGSLDALTREQMQNELTRLCAEKRYTVVFVTHDIEEAIFLGDHILVMSQRPGRIVGQFDVPFPRPRPDTLRNAPEFAALRGQVSATLKSTSTNTSTLITNVSAV